MTRRHVIGFASLALAGLPVLAAAERLVPYAEMDKRWEYSTELAPLHRRRGW